MKELNMIKIKNNIFTITTWTLSLLLVCVTILAVASGSAGIICMTIVLAVIMVGFVLERLIDFADQLMNQHEDREG